MKWFIPTLMVACSATPSLAQSCALREVVLRDLQENYGETPQVRGLTSNQYIMEIHANKETGSWTATLTDVNGRTCLVSSGQAFDKLAPTIQGEEM